MNFLRKRFIFSLKYLTSPFEYRIFTSFIMLKREVAVKLPAFVFVIDTLQHNRYN